MRVAERALNLSACILPRSVLTPQKDPRNDRALVQTMLESAPGEHFYAMSGHKPSPPSCPPPPSASPPKFCSDARYLGSPCCKCSSTIHAAWHALLYFGLPFGSCLGATNRRKIREHNKIPGKLYQDVLCHCCCGQSRSLSVLEAPGVQGKGLLSVDSAHIYTQQAAVSLIFDPMRRTVRSSTGGASAEGGRSPLPTRRAPVGGSAARPRACPAAQLAVRECA